MKQQIIALGGGGFSMEPDNPLIDRYILQQSKTKKPKVCFLGTASGEAEGYVLRFYTSFLQLNCIPTHLSLFRQPTNDLESFILEQDVIYVGGGNTKSLLALWKDWNLDVYLRTAWKNGVVLAGLSAGSICWFEEGLSDYIGGQFNKLQCLGFLRGSNCPHYDGEVNRRPAYHRLILAGEISDGIAADDGAALHYVGLELKHVVSSRLEAKAYRVTKKDGEIQEETIPSLFLGV
ncbi:MAG: Type 1 glutamine amidotransferase-like domain-containing protein [Pyrinomonadaceae bacterium]